MNNSTPWLITHIGTLGPLHPPGTSWLKGADMASFPIIQNAWLLTDNNGSIVDFGAMDEVPDGDGAARFHAQGGWLLPGFVDSHTHLVFGKWREAEMVSRIQGETYEEIAAKGGGILNSAQYVNTLSENDLFDSALALAQGLISSGTVALEVKSGYGLTTESELKMLRVIRRLGERLPIPVKSTFLGAHALPMAYRADRSAYIRIILDDMLPAVAGESLADYCDVFCDRGFFTPEESVLILRKAQSLGLKARVHGNELGLTGGVQVAVEVGAKSVDHLEHTSAIEWELIKHSDTMPTLLPGTAFFLGIPYPQARDMLSAGLGVTLASDFNPGTCPSGNMSFVLSLACLRMGLLPEEAFNAATLNAAYSLDLHNTLGSIVRGKKASFILTHPMPSLAYLPYAFGQSTIASVWINGQPYKNAH